MGYKFTGHEKSILTELYMNVGRKTKECYSPGCHNKSILSHILQAKGVLSSIAPNGEVVQLQYHFPWLHKSLYSFKKCGIRQGDVLRFRGFCSKCDSHIFKDIESNVVDYSSYHNQLLFCYRGLLNEYCKQQYSLKFYEKLFASNKLNSHIKSIYADRRSSYLVSSKFLAYYKVLCEDDLTNGTRNYEFIYFRLPKIEICTSSVYSFPSTDILLADDRDMLQIERMEQIVPTMAINFINLIPNGDCLNVIFGSSINKNIKGREDLKAIVSLSETKKIKKISDILIKYVETRCVSEKLFNLWKERRIDEEILKQIENFYPLEMKYKNTRFNMFNNVL